MSFLNEMLVFPVAEDLDAMKYMREEYFHEPLDVRITHLEDKVSFLRVNAQHDEDCMGRIFATIDELRDEILDLRRAVEEERVCHSKP